ncbi:MacS family sensor histidine kinase [Streptomyces sp. NPDC056149]|uniref:MacS family sensor histidine kinase n=2 Tax=unclassified Streptomyces TaxID=2593676 RepID=UPI0035D7B3F9
MTDADIQDARTAGGDASGARDASGAADGGRQKALRMSVELPLWRALTGYRILTLVYALCLCTVAYPHYAHPLGAAAYMAVLTLWTGLTWRRTTSAERCTRRFLVVDLGFAVGGILLTAVIDTQARIMDGSPTLPSIWTAGAVLGFAIKGGWRWAAVASTIVAAANLVERQELARDTVHNVVLVWVASVAIGYVVEVARASERTLARALQIEAATRERERLARDIHDSVLQVLAMVQRRGTAIGGEAAELGRMAGEQEVALRTLVAGGLVPRQRVAVAPADTTAVGAAARGPAPAGRGGPCDLMALLAPYAGAGVTLSGPGGPVALPAAAAGELTAAVGAALDNVRVHVGAEARAWILVEDEPDAVVVTVRDEGPGIPEGRLAAAEREGRLGAALSIRGRLRELGGGAEWLSVPGQGTEVELKVPKGAAPRDGRRGRTGA